MSLQPLEARICSDPCAGPCAGCPDRIVCRCLKVTEEAISNAIVELGLRSVKDVRKATGAGDGCTCCHDSIRELIVLHVESRQLLAAS
jgi:assimilatory nitrate reductase electron transfer subunit